MRGGQGEGGLSCRPAGRRRPDAPLLLQASFSFEAGRRCPSGEGGFEFDTKQGNLLFKAVEAAIHRQQQVSRGNQGGPEMLQDQNQSLERPPPRPLPRHIPQSPAAQVGLASSRLHPLTCDHMTSVDAVFVCADGRRRVQRGERACQRSHDAPQRRLRCAASAPTTPPAGRKHNTPAVTKMEMFHSVEASRRTSAVVVPSKPDLLTRFQQRIVGNHF